MCNNHFSRPPILLTLLSALVLPLLALSAADLPCVAVKLSGNQPLVKHYPSLDAVPGGHQDLRYKTEWLLLVRLPEGRNTRKDNSGDFTITRPFYCSIYEITQAQWEHVVGSHLLDLSRQAKFSNPEYWQTRPIESVSWNEIRGNPNADCNWPAAGHAVDPISFMGLLRQKTGNQLEFDLPTEAQWEYACRAGTATDWNNGQNLSVKDHRDPSMDILGRYAHNGGMVPNGTMAMQEPDTASSTNHGTAAVGSYLPNAWGLYDMHGNVMEWCLDWFVDAKEYQELLTGRDPTGPATGTIKVVRGGGWWNFLYGGAEPCSSSSRAYACYPGSGLKHHAIGLRVVAPAAPPPTLANSSHLRPLDRVLFLGDSITELSVYPMGYFTQLKEVVKDVYPTYQNEFVAMGFSGHTVFSWHQGILPDSRTKSIKSSGGFDLNVELNKPADIVFILLGMNDILKPTISGSPDSIATWIAAYRGIVHQVRSRVSPREIFLCDITPLTEDPSSPKNLLRQQLGKALDTLAKTEGCQRVKTADSLFDCLAAARQIRPMHNIIPDTVHPKTYEGNAAIVRALFSALNDKPLIAATNNKIDGYLAQLSTMAPIVKPKPEDANRPGWQVLCLADVHGVFSHTNYLPQNATPAIEPALIRGDLKQGGKWQISKPSPDYTDGLNPDTINPYQLIAGSQRDLLYAHRWVYSEREREVDFNFNTRTFASQLGCVLWINGTRIGQLYPIKGTPPPLRATLKQGWNRILIRNDHNCWQRQFSCTIKPLNNDNLSQLRYSNTLQKP